MTIIIKRKDCEKQKTGRDQDLVDIKKLKKRNKLK